jgi:hypothetical protein
VRRITISAAATLLMTVVWTLSGVFADDIPVPGGRLVAPLGCAGRVHAGIDAVFGMIHCGSELDIYVTGGMIDACPKRPSSPRSAEAVPARFDLRTEDGSPLCISSRLLGERTEVSVGLGGQGLVFRATVSNASDLLIVLSTAGSYRAAAKRP